MSIFRDKNISKRLFYTIGVLLIYKLLSYITLPGIDPKQLAKVANDRVLTFLSMFSGGGFQSFSLLSMGITAYVTAQIFVQIFQSLIPTLKSWSDAGKVGRQKLDKLTRIIALFLSLGQSMIIIADINNITRNKFLVHNDFISIAFLLLLLTSGTFIALWLSDRITENGLGKGISVIISAGIISKLPQTIQQSIGQNTYLGRSNVGFLIGGALGIFLMTWFIAWFNGSEHRTYVQYARKAVFTGQQSYLPLKIIIPNVVPIVLASSLLTVPQLILTTLQRFSDQPWYQLLNQIFSLNSSVGIILYGVLIVWFTYYYSQMQIQPDKIAENFSKQEAYVLGINPGDETTLYFTKLLNYLSLPGSLFLLVIAVVPLLISHYTSANLQVGLGGSSILIILGTLIDIGTQIEGLKQKNEYGGFLSEKYTFD